MALNSWEKFCYRFPVEEIQCPDCWCWVFSQYSADNKHYESSFSTPGTSALSEDRTEENKCSAGAGVSFSTTIKPCPSCFSILVPITKEYMHSLWAQTNRHRSTLSASRELNVTFNTIDLFSFFLFVFVLNPVLVPPLVRKHKERNWREDFPNL